MPKHKMETSNPTHPPIELRRRILEIAIPLGIFLSLLPFFETIDLSFATYGNNSSPTYDLVYKYGVLPGQITAFLSLFLLFVRRYRLIALYLLLVLTIGAGIIGHGVFKRYWHRPRPKQIEQFGGHYPYIPIYKPYVGQQEDHLRSLPSGHSTMGFYFYAFYFIGRRRGCPKVAAGGYWIGTILGTTLGLLLSIARIFQGGHFLSDCAASALIMWETSALLDWCFARKQM